MQGAVQMPCHSLGKLREAAPLPTASVNSRPHRTSRRRDNVKPHTGFVRVCRLATNAAAAETSPETSAGLEVQPNPSSTQGEASVPSSAPALQGAQVRHIPPAGASQLCLSWWNPYPPTC
eukprot:1156662-Pelagomonas_calceolata.AAC.22